MKALIRFFIGLLLTVLSSDMNAQELLEQYKWKKRVIILVTSTPDHPDYIAQLAQLRQVSPGVEERDLVILSNQADSVRSSSITEKYQTGASGFRFILIGKDGTIKKDSDELVEAGDLFALIDSMPMRKREMRNADH